MTTVRPDAPALRGIAEQAFSRTAGAPLVSGNAIRLLRDAGENYPAWLDAIGSARRSVLFENYIVHDDDMGRRFAEALAAKAREGVRVRVIYDWFGCLGAASRAFTTARATALARGSSPKSRKTRASSSAESSGALL